MLAMTNFLPCEKPPVGDFSGEIIQYSGNFVKMHFAERCACYPYIFPTILSAHCVLHALDVGTDLLRRGGAILL